MDTALIIDLQTGSEERFKDVCLAYHQKLYFYFLKDNGSASLSQDLVQETFIKLWRFRMTLKPDLTLSIQIFHIARTVAIDMLRRDARNRVHSVPTAHIIELSDSAYEPEPEVSPAIVKIRSSLAILPPVRRKVIEQKLEGFSNPEIASNLSISPKTVANHLNKAMHQLKKHLELPLFLSIMILFLN